MANEAWLSVVASYACKAGFVEVPEHYLYSSATDYHTVQKGLLNIIILESLNT